MAQGNKVKPMEDKIGRVIVEHIVPSPPVFNDKELREMPKEDRLQYMKLMEMRAELVNNLMMSRSEMVSKKDPRRNIEKECGYPESIYAVNADFYKELYDSEGIPRRIVDLMADECWQEQPDVYEDEDEEVETEFEKDVKELPRNLNGDSWYEDERITTIWDYLKRVDAASGIGRFGVLFMGFDDGGSLDSPLPGVMPDYTAPEQIEATKEGDNEGPPNAFVYPIQQSNGEKEWTGEQLMPSHKPVKPTKKLKLLFMRVFDESLVQITRYESDIRSPRYGQPIIYKITMNDPKQATTGIGITAMTLNVHWSRVIHVAERLSSSEVFAVPRMQPNLHRILDIIKLLSGSAEMYWKGAFPGISFETNPQLGGDVKINSEELKRQMFEYQNDLQRFLITRGMTANQLSPQVVDPSMQIDCQLGAICIEQGIPKRVFEGSERGELASSQDSKAWATRVFFRQTMYLTPRLIVRFFDRLIQVGCLTQPEKYNVKWPKIDSMTELEKAQMAAQLMTALSTYVSGGVEQILPLAQMFAQVLGWDKALVDSIVEAAAMQDPADSFTMQQQGQVDENGNPIDPSQSGDPAMQEDPSAEQDDTMPLE